MTTIDTDQKRIESFITRGVETIYPNTDYLKDRLASGEQLSMYLGIDPTGPTLHLGHVITLRKLAEFQKMGHKVILLIGDFTARIGDPTDKSEARKQLSAEEVTENARLYQEQASLFLDFDGDNPAELRYNSEWLDEMNFADVMELASRMTVHQMLERDMFAKRMESQKPIYIHEFFYPLMQGYDAVAMDVDGEIGGNDQTFNMLVGRDLMKDIKGKDKFVLPMKLLVDTSGAKMGKTTGNMLSFLDDPAEKFGKVMSWTDGMIEPGFELLTDADLEDIRARLGAGENPRDLKKELARKVVTMFHDEAAAQEAQSHWETQFSEGGVPENIPEHLVETPSEIMDLLRDTGVVQSGKEARRKIDEGAVQLDGKKIKEIKLKLTKEQLEQGVVLKVGRKMFRIKKKDN
jgi:tyrosyl-tRNA synthetase